MIEIRWDLNREQQLYDQRKQLLLICHLKNSKNRVILAKNLVATLSMVHTEQFNLDGDRDKSLMTHLSFDN